MMETVIEPERLLGLAEEMATRAQEQNGGHAAVAVLAAHAALEAMVNRLGGEIIGSFNYRARFLRMCTRKGRAGVPRNEARRTYGREFTDLRIIRVPTLKRVVSS